LKVLTGGAGAVLTGAAVVPAAALMGEPGYEKSNNAGTWIRVASLESLETGRPTKAAVIGSRDDAWTRAPDQRLGSVWLIRDSESAVRAFSTICPHLGCGIEHEGDHFECPCHDTAFDLRGSRLSGPSPRGMDPLQVRIVEGWVQVRYQRFRQGVSDRIPV
jgi:Rieske Fe-S protein